MEQVAGNVSSNVEEGLDVVPAGQELPDKAETSLMLLSLSSPDSQV